MADVRDRIAAGLAGQYRAMGMAEVSDALRQVTGETDYRAAMHLAASRLAADSTVAGHQAVSIAELYLLAGAKEQAMVWLETAYRDRDPFLVTLGLGFSWDGLRSDARFNNLVRQMGFPSVKGVR